MKMYNSSRLSPAPFVKAVYPVAERSGKAPPFLKADIVFLAKREEKWYANFLRKL